MSKKIIISDSSLRDGSHALSHQLAKEQIELYCKAIDQTGVDIVEVGHGNGLGASSLLVGESRISDEYMLKTARENLVKSKLGIHVIPGFATIERDLKPAISWGVDVFRIASHCTEADITERHIRFCRDSGKTVFGVLMMSHMVDKEILCEESMKMQNYGAEAVILMDSAGNSLPQDVREKVSYLVRNIAIPIGFHAHNNLGMGIANSIEAVRSGASIIDGCSRGFGAGAGNAQLEIIAAVFQKIGINTGIDLYKLLDASDIAEKEIMKDIPYVKSISIISGLAGVFSGFVKPVMRISKEFSLDPRDVFFELGRRKILAGQEDLIIEVARDLSEMETI